MRTAQKNSSLRRKLALIIGNENYSALHNRLNHSINNARDLNELLKKIDFDVTMYIDADSNMMLKIQRFSKRISNGDLVLFYFSGHGYEVSGKNYLIPVDDTKIKTDIDVEDIGINLQSVLERLIERNSSYVTILILDCCSLYWLKPPTTSNSIVHDKGLSKIQPPSGTFIQFACAANQTIDDSGEKQRNSLFSKHLIRNIARKNINVTDVFRDIAKNVYLESNSVQKPLSMNGLGQHDGVFLNAVSSIIPNIPYDTVWKSKAKTIAGIRGPGPALTALHFPKGIFVNKKQTVFIADSSNNRIMKYNRGVIAGKIIAGKNISGYGSDRMWEPSNVIYDEQSKSYIICDYQNRRVLRWASRSSTFTEELITNKECFGLAMDDEGFLYVSDTELHEVRRYRTGERYGTVVAGGNGQGSRLKQLNHPTYIFVGPDQVVYVSDTWNNRVVKWEQGAKEGIIVAGGHHKGKDETQLFHPAGLIVDRLSTIYVADYYNHRVMRWYKDASHGHIIAGNRYLPGNNANKLNGPEGLAFDQHGNLYVADSNNHRVQRFSIRNI
ncbi:unnamed protein product [Rotaria magnacalcarata]|uniref:Caspase family p20 domain-containing protein n=1 Tax=Rotaria magnacalcarata TaxID=392030 RepID=A0A819V5W0_9BILA|nr:unnamed protein product [Rotaria magnacalcarata]CAF4102688.1 unnamed protein product [Rotaria magnacalcarata]